jgi:hypothetical protein
MCDNNNITIIIIYDTRKKITTSQTNLLSFPTFPRHIDTKSFAPQMSPAAADVTTKNRGFQTSQSLPSTALGHQKRPGDHPKKITFLHDTSIDSNPARNQWCPCNHSKPISCMKQTGSQVVNQHVLIVCMWVCISICIRICIWLCTMYFVLCVMHYYAVWCICICTMYNV